VARNDSITVIGRYNAQNTLNAIVERLEYPELAAGFVYEVLEEEYDRKFRDWGGWLVDSGRMAASLTSDSSPDAVRRAHQNAIEFGSTVPYARFWSGPLLDISDRAEAEVTEAMADFLVPRETRSVFPERASL
jgi:hypothetical protein